MQSGHNKHKNEASNSYPSVDSNHSYDWRLTTVNILLQKQMTREQNPFMWVIVSSMWVIVSFMWVIVSGAQAVSVTRAFTEWWSFYHQKQQHDLDFNGRFPGAHSNPRKGPQQRTCQFPVSPPPPPCGTEHLALVEQVSAGGRLSCHTTISVKTLKERKSTDPKHEKSPLASAFLHPTWTSGERGVAPFILALHPCWMLTQVRKDCITKIIILAPVPD